MDARRIVALALICSGCSTPSPAIRDYCLTTGSHYPLKASRQDTPLTKRQILNANTIHERLCNAAK